MTITPIPDIDADTGDLGEGERRRAGQRRINILWERTQAIIAVGVVGAAVLVNAMLALAPYFAPHPSGDVPVPNLTNLNVMAALVTGFYFGRTNHTRSGGVGGDSAGER